MPGSGYITGTPIQKGRRQAIAEFRIGRFADLVRFFNLLQSYPWRFLLSGIRGDNLFVTFHLRLSESPILWAIDLRSTLNPYPISSVIRMPVQTTCSRFLVVNGSPASYRVIIIREHWLTIGCHTHGLIVKMEIDIDGMEVIIDGQNPWPW